MDKDIIRRLANKIVNRNCALFLGAGLTASSGGVTWSGLIDILKKRFNYSSPLTDPFEIVGDMYRINGKKIVYDEVKKTLKNAHLDDVSAELSRLPWITVFSTNYDTAFEDSLRANQDLTVRPVFNGKNFSLDGGSIGELQYVYLMGHIDSAYDDPTCSMVLTSEDLISAKEARTRLLDKLSNHAACLSFLFIGYSFDDNLFLETLQKMSSTLSTPKETYYAVFKEMPDREKTYMLAKRYNVEIIVSDIKDFIPELLKEVAHVDPRDHTLLRIPIGNDSVSVKTTSISTFLNYYDPVLVENMEEAVLAFSFFKGDTKSFKPFALEWYFKRSEISNIVNEALKASSSRDGVSIISIEGNPGSGRTFANMAALYSLIRNHRAIGIRIPRQSYHPFNINYDAVLDFLEEIEMSSGERRVDGYKYIVFWADYMLSESDLIGFSRLADYIRGRDKQPIILLYEGVTSRSKNIAFSFADIIGVGKSSLNLSDTISKTEQESLVQYINTISRQLKFPEKSIYEIRKIVNEEKSFLPVMYRILYPTKQSINEIVRQEFQSIVEEKVRHCVLLCALVSALQIDMPISVLRKALGDIVSEKITFPDIFDIISKSKAFTVEKSSFRGGHSVAIYHQLIAEYLTSIAGSKQIDDYLVHIAKVVDLRTKVEADFVQDLFVFKGTQLVESDNFERVFSVDGLEKAMVELKTRQPARPILHHLARLYYKLNTHREEIIPLLNDALVESPESYELNERSENIKTTLAQIKWSQNRESLKRMPRQSPELCEIFTLLDSAKDAANNYHPYDLHAAILKELYQSQEDQDEKTHLIKEVVDVLQEASVRCAGDPVESKRFQKNMLDAISDIDPESVMKISENLIKNKDDGTGYYILGKKAYYKDSNIKQAVEFLETALSASQYPASAIMLRMAIGVKEENSPDYHYLFKLSDMLEARADYKDTWQSAYHKAVIYAINGKYEKAQANFKKSTRLVPKGFALYKSIDVFWKEGGRRKAFTGKIWTNLTKHEGRINMHNVRGWEGQVFFYPSFQEKIYRLKVGIQVDFELGFSPRGPVAFDVRPHMASRMGE